MATTKIIPNVLELNPGDPENVLKATNAVTVSNASGSNKYYFDGVYQGKFGLRIGTTVLTGVPSAHPIAILNDGLTGITYTGTVNEGTANVPDPGGPLYTFYSGDVTITVTTDFGVASYYCKIHGYMGGLDNLVSVYSDAGLKMPKGTAFPGGETAFEGMMRNDTSQSSDGSASTMQHYNGTNWKNFVNKEIITPVTDSIFYHLSMVDSASRTNISDGSNSGGQTWVDISGNGYDWTIASSFSASLSDNYMTLASTNEVKSSSSSLNPGSDISLEIWYWMDSSRQNQYVQGVANTGSLGSSGFISYLNTYPTEYQNLSVYNSGSTSLSILYDMPDSTWQQHMVTYDNSTGNAKFYINGSTIGNTGSTASKLAASAGTHSIGYLAQYGFSSSNFVGRLGIIRVYSKKLSDAEVLQNYNANKADYGLS